MSFLRRSMVVRTLCLIVLSILLVSLSLCPVTAQDPGPEHGGSEHGGIVSPLTGWPPPQAGPAASALPPSLARSRAESVNEAVGARGTRPGLVKQFEETSYYLQATDLVSATLGWAVGYPHWDQAARLYVGTIVKTADGGETWHAQVAGTNVPLYDVDFVDEERGWVVGAAGTILSTADGGQTWIEHTLPITDEMRSVGFVDASRGWATSVKPVHYDTWGEADNWAASTWHTTDGGVTWAEQAMPEGASILHDIDFVDAQVGWAVGVKYIGDDQYGGPEHRALVYATDDGGQTWQELYAPDLQVSLTCVDLVDAQHGWAAGFPTSSSVSGGFVFSTDDGGTTWDRHEPGGFFSPLWDVEFLDQQRGYVVGANYVGAWGPPVWRTLDGGETWEEILMSDHENDGLFGLAVTQDRVVALGDHDYMITSVDPWGAYGWPHGENLFTQEFINVHYRFEDVFFLDENSGWAAGSRSYRPDFTGQVILATSDGGSTWVTLYEHAPPLEESDLFSYHRLDGIYFADSQNGWAVGADEYYYPAEPRYQGAIIRTQDGGLHWEEQGAELYASWGLEFFDVQFLDDQEGWALATDNFPSDNIFLAHTTDGGGQWDWVDTGHPGPLAIGYALVQGELDFVDDQHGWAVGGLGSVVHTADGGTTWISQTLTCGTSSCSWHRLNAVDMIDVQDGWIAGEGLFRTGDAGAHWDEQELDVGVDIQDVEFVDAMNGWLAGNSGLVMVTHDGGDTWQLVGNDLSYNALRGISFVSAGKGWLVGDYGTILTTVEIPYWGIYLPLVVRAGP